MLTFRKPRLLTDSRGLSTIEFAFSLPLLIFVLLYGSYEVWQMISASLRVNRAASHVASVAARADATLDEDALTSLLKSANTIASPTPLLSNGRVVLSAVEGGAAGKILWQRCQGDKLTFTSAIGSVGATANLSGSSLPAPPDGTTALVAEIFYEYHPFLAGSAMPITLKHKAISLGREEIPDTVLATGVASSC